MNVTSRDGAHLNLTVTGEGQPIVMIHGFGSNQQIWNLQVPYLSDLGYSVVTYDQRGHGASDKEATCDSIDTLIDDLKDLIDGLHLENPILVGHSMGASVAYGFLKKYLGEAKAVIAVDQSPKMLNTPSWQYGYCDVTRANYRLKLKNGPQGKQTVAPLNDKLLWDLRAANKQFPFDNAAHCELMYDHAKRDWRKTLTTTTTPVLLVCAAKSPFFDPAFGQVMAKENPVVETVTVADSGHLVMGGAGRGL